MNHQRRTSRPHLRTFLSVVACAILIAASQSAAHAQPTETADHKPVLARLTLASPLNHQVFQRESATQGRIVVEGQFDRGQDGQLQLDRLEARLIGKAMTGNHPDRWQRLPLDPRIRRFRGELAAPAGGWYRLEVRLSGGDTVVAETVVESVGVGEVFVIAGQSNSANHGEERQQPTNDLVVAFTGAGWAPARDPQPGASGGGGSFIPAFGDAMVARFSVPIGVVCVGAGGTSVREWLPKGERFSAPPTTFANTLAVGDKAWASTGELFARLSGRLAPLGIRGVRAVLWHQGESDNQQPEGHNIPPAEYAAHLKKVIVASRKAADWPVPWFVAQASYHTPEETGSAELRAAQRSLAKSGLALEGPNTDSLTGDFRDGGGRGVHFSAKGLKRHGELWAEKVGPWLAQQLPVN